MPAIASLVLCFFLTALSATASASLISHLSERDWMAVDDGLITFDSTTGLEWLDVSVTAGNSILDTEAELFFDAAGLGGGFRWATNLEIVGLMSHLDFVLFDGSPQEASSTDAASITGTNLLLDLISTTIEANGVRSAEAMSRGASDPDILGQYGRGDIAVRSDFARARSPLFKDGSWTESSSNSEVGSWLVREVPVLPPFYLMLGALAFLAFRRREQS